MKKLIQATIGLILLIGLFGCSANWHAKQSKKHMEKAKMKDPTISFIDTLYITDTTFIPRIETDTVFHIDTDTIEIEKERLRIRYVRTTDSVYLSGECDSIVIEKEVPYTVQETVYIERLPEWWRKGKWFILFGAVVLIALAIFLRR